MRVNEYKVLLDAVEAGVTRGINRAYKHVEANEHPTGAALRDSLVAHVLHEICEYFRLEDEYAQEDSL